MIEGPMLQHCGPIFFYQSSPLSVCRNGTFGLVDTGTKKLLVTCAHVWTGYQKLRKKKRNLNLAILVGTGRPIHLSYDPLHLDEKLDLATWDMAPLMSEFAHRQFFPISNQRLPPLIPKTVLATIGYMGKGRGREVSPEGANFAYNFSGMSVSGTDQTATYILADMTTTKRFGRDGNRMRRLKLYGGLSGSPVYLLQPNYKLKLVGFITDCVFGQLKMTHVACLNQDGTVGVPTVSLSPARN